MAGRVGPRLVGACTANHPSFAILTQQVVVASIVVLKRAAKANISVGIASGPALGFFTIWKITLRGGANQWEMYHPLVNNKFPKESWGRHGVVLRQASFEELKMGEIGTNIEG
ncbi:hypothetical protein RRF57_001015 [Xylaria bambusicola]|uniref:Uncharacterized protein n=1 Tax=Xylaria bambusicola TaxID=326684 RepID=A0AAN7UAV5_9PEZI